MDALTAPSVTNNAENVTPAENQHPLSNSKSLNSKNSSENRPKKHPRRLFGHRASDGQPPRQRSWFGGLSHSKSAKKTTTSKRPPSRRMSAPHLFGKKKKDTNKTMRARARTESTASGRSFPTPDHDPKAELDALLAADNDTLKNWSPSELIAAAAVDGTAHSETPVIPKTEPSSAQGSVSRVPFAVVASARRDSRSRRNSRQLEDGKRSSVAGGRNATSDPAACKTESDAELAADDMTHGLLCPRCKVSMASIPALLLHQSECATRPCTPDLKEKFNIQRDQFHLLFDEARSIHGKLHEANVAVAIAQDTATQWREIAAQKEKQNELSPTAANSDPQGQQLPASGDKSHQANGQKSPLIEAAVQTEADQAMLQLREQCSAGTAELEAQILQMNRLTQSLADIQGRHLRVVAQKAQDAAMFQEEIEALQARVLSKEVQLQDQRAAASQLHREKQKLDNQVKSLETELAAARQEVQSHVNMAKQVVFDKSQNDGGGGSGGDDLQEKYKELQNRHAIMVQRAQETQQTLESRLAAKASALHASMVTRETLAAQLKTISEEKNQLMMQLEGIRQAQQACASSDTTATIKQTPPSKPLVASLCSHSDQKRIHPHSRAAPTPALGEDFCEQGTDDDIEVATFEGIQDTCHGSGGGAADNAAAVAGMTSEQGSSATPVVRSTLTSSLAVSDSALEASQRNLMLRVMALSQAPRAQQVEAIAEVSRRLENVASLRQALANGERTQTSLTVTEREGLHQESAWKTQLMLMSQLSKSSGAVDLTENPNQASSTTAAAATPAEDVLENRRPRRRRQQQGTEVVEEACQCTIM